MKIAAAGLVLSALGSAAVSAQQAGEPLNFQSCPIVRDTPTVLCWLSEYEGELYYLGIQTDISSDFHPPYLGHQVIVEGVVTDKPRICGGVVLDQVVASPVAERDANCSTVLPVDPRYTVDFAPRPPGPSGGRLAFQGGPPPQQPAAPARETRSFTINYYFDGKVEGRNAGDLSRIARFVDAVGASRIEIVGVQGDLLLSDGSTLTEREGLAQARAEEVAGLLKSGGVAAAEWAVSWEAAPAPDGVEDWRERRTVVTVHP